MQDTYQDLLVTDIERIQRAKEVLRKEISSRKEKIEAINLIKLYGDIAREYKDSKDEETRYRAEEILFELHH